MKQLVLITEHRRLVDPEDAVLLIQSADDIAAETELRIAGGDTALEINRDAHEIAGQLRANLTSVADYFRQRLGMPEVSASFERMAGAAEQLEVHHLDLMHRSLGGAGLAKILDFPTAAAKAEPKP
jgi:hypothetical protein